MTNKQKQQNARNSLLRRLTKAEGRKKQVSIGNMREIYACLVHLCAANPKHLQTLVADILFANTRRKRSK